MPALDNLPEFVDRFWYWQGASGRRYIHSIYTPGNCPPLPGAIFVAVHRFHDGRRLALETGRFDDDRDFARTAGGEFSCGLRRVDEIHVHLLAGSHEEAGAVLADIEAGISRRAIDGGFGEPQAVTRPLQPELFSLPGAAPSLAASV